MDNPKEEKTNVPLSPSARRFVESLRETTGVAKVEALSRILEFVATFDHKAIMAILYRDEQKRRELARLVLLEMAGLKSGDFALPSAAEELDVDEAANIAQAMILRLKTAYRAEVALGKAEKAEKKRKG